MVKRIAKASTQFFTGIIALSPFVARHRERGPNWGRSYHRWGKEQLPGHFCFAR